MNPSVGLATKAGLITAIGAFASAVLLYLTGDHTAQSVTAVEAAGLGLVSLIAVKIGRYLQSLKNPLIEPFLGGEGEAPPVGGAETDPAITGE